MTGERWIVVRNWERYQHRDAARTETPAWIKLHTRLLSDEDFLDLSIGRRMLLVGLWLEYARTHRRLPDDTRSLSRRLSQRVLRRDLEALNDAGFIAFSASEPASKSASEPASLEEKRGDKRTPNPADAGNDASKTENPPDNGEVQNLAETIDEALAGTTPCAICGTPVRVGYRCPNCNANPRAAGSSSRQQAKRLTTSSAYERAATYTRHEGYAYDLEAFRRDLDRFPGLTSDERRQLEELREQVIDDVDAYSW